MDKAKAEFSWRVAHRLVLAACLAGGWTAVGSLAKAHAKPPSQGSESNSRLVSAEAGQANVDAARGQDLTAGEAQDCSHLVHQTYLNAGFEYPYASSFELYAGNENFERVKKPQPGDVMVWAGHGGSGRDTLEHSFYSLVSTGLEAQNYLGPYWVSRGRPRFYRYKVDDAEIMTASTTPASSRTSDTGKQRETEVAVEERTPVAASNSNRPPKAVSDRARVVNGPAALPAPVVESNTSEVPQSIVIGAGNKRPTTSQVAEGISELSNAAGTVCAQMALQNWRCRWSSSSGSRWSAWKSNGTTDGRVCKLILGRRSMAAERDI